MNKEQVYCTSYDGQSQVEKKVYQGYYKKASMNNLLGNFMLSDILKASGGTENI
ncbi:Hsp70 family protein [Clostridium gelidum]|uniref:Hsp70 family protein n=1 Tax=Clostridium gelidum TaxID=704125 RepID=UPI001CC7074D